MSENYFSVLGKDAEELGEIKRTYKNWKRRNDRMIESERERIQLLQKQRDFDIMLEKLEKDTREIREYLDEQKIEEEKLASRFMLADVLEDIEQFTAPYDHEAEYFIMDYNFDPNPFKDSCPHYYTVRTPDETWKVNSTILHHVKICWKVRCGCGGITSQNCWEDYDRIMTAYSPFAESAIALKEFWNAMQAKTSHDY